MTRQRTYFGRRVLALILAAAVTAGIFYIVLNPTISGEGAIQRTLPIYSVQREYRTASLTFNASGSENGSTEEILATLTKYGVKATFFVTGQWAEENPELLRKISVAGHEIMNLSDNYSNFKSMSAAEMLESVSACSNKIEAVTGTRPTMFRAPYGDYDDHVVTTVSAAGLTMIQWDVDSRDCTGLSATAIASRVTGKIQPGSIVLLHCGQSATAEALPMILRTLIQSGYTLTPVSDLVLQSEYTISGTGRQMPA